MPIIEKLGSFYLGKEYDLAARQLKDVQVNYDSRDLTTHAVCVGMTGSGKTGLCIDLLEEAALDGVPAIIIDPKGDITNLLLTFPDLRPEDFKPWINADDAARKGLSVDDFAVKTAHRLAQRAGKLGRRPRPHQGAQGRGRLRHLHPRLRGRAAGEHPVQLQGAEPRLGHRDGDPARPDPGHRFGAAGAGGHRGRSRAQPRAHPALQHPGERLARRPGSGHRQADHGRAEAAVPPGRRVRRWTPSSRRRTGSAWR